MCVQSVKEPQVALQPLEIGEDAAVVEQEELVMALVLPEELPSTVEGLLSAVTAGLLLAVTALL